jgi:hypothetical protein
MGNVGEQGERSMTKPGHYWDHQECRWVRYAVAEVPAQPTAEQQAADIAADLEADVRSG